MSKAERHASNGVHESGAAGQTATTADTIEQVRELLFGHEKRSAEQRDHEINERINVLNADMLERIAMLESRLVETERALEAQHNTALENISAAISELGTRVGQMVTHRRGR
ncbi:MAG: hypothetical protein KGQ37_08870 [Hyphomicrobiales bacterium]|nr:hypothetical protein [Hyphomicrobiales bacterium]